MKHQPSYYAILTANVRYDKRINFRQKVLFAEITALTQSKGYCFASNAYFAELYDVSPETISRDISALKGSGYISVVIEKEAGNQRKIYPATAHKKSTPIDHTRKTPIDHTRKTPIDHTRKHNNTSINSINSATANAEAPSSQKKDEDVADEFAEFWEIFGNKKSKKRAFTSFKRLTKTKRAKCIERVPAYLDYLSANEHLQQMHPTTWINGERWEDDFSIEKVSSNTDHALRDASMTQEELTAYAKYIDFVQMNCMELYRSECRVLSHSEYLDYVHLRSQPGAMRIAKATRYKILVSVHEKLDANQYLRSKYSTVYSAYKQHISAELNNKKSPVL